jgi:streptogramin lyase
MAPRAEADGCPPDRTYTLNADFDEGMLINVNHDILDQLQLNEVAVPNPFIWVAASQRGTIVRIHTKTGEILGEYLSAPDGRGRNPSRTTVDLAGNVWTGNRNEAGLINGVKHGSAVKIGLVIGGTRVDADGTPTPGGGFLKGPFPYHTCDDRNGDGLIKTSRGLGDIRAWPDITDGLGGITGIVEDADDECILVYQRLADAEGMRHLSVDANNDVWVGGYPGSQRMFYKLHGDTGAILDSFNARDFGCGGYGGLIDGDGVLWSASIHQNKLLRYVIQAGTGSCINVSYSYGLGIDTNGFVWNSMWTNNSIVKVSPGGVVEQWFPKPTGGASDDRGVAVTPIDNDVWVASSGGSDVSRLDNGGNFRKVISVGSTPTGVAVDGNGQVWVTNLGSDNVMRINPGGGIDGLGAVDLTVDLNCGAVFCALDPTNLCCTTRAGPYNYSDMTGIVALAAAANGTWTVVRDGGKDGIEWGTVTWNTEGCAAPYEPPGTNLTVEVRASDTQAGLPSEAFVEVENGVKFAGIFGGFIEVRVTFSGVSDPFATPVLCDLTVQTNCPVGPIPAVSEWGLVVMTLLLLTGLKIKFGRRRRPAAA